MDTRFWGPSGWKLLHQATFDYCPSKRVLYGRFLETIPYILPCKFCRTSLTDFYALHTYKKALSSQAALVKWLYEIHNCVNDKLRDQSLHPEANPTLAQVKLMYTTWMNEYTPLQRLATFWDFLFAVAYNHPKEASKGSTPIQDCPSDAKRCADPCVRNRWNTMEPGQRMHWYEQFWDTLPAVLGDLEPSWRQSQTTTKRDLSCRRSVVAWLWRQRCAMDPEFKDPYTSICKRVASYSSGCAAAKRAKTCRKKRH